MKRALISGITGQDGSYLADLLLSKGYEVHGIVRRSSTFNRERLSHIQEEGSYTSDTPKKRFFLHYGDLTDSSSIEEIMKRVNPNEIYNLGAQSHVRISFDIPENTANVVAIGTLRVLEAMRKFCPNAKFYQAGTSEMFGKVLETPQTEKTPFYPRSPYGYSKLFAHWQTIGAREAHDLFACNGILFNHESERRGEPFVTRKITRSLARIKVGLQKKISFGNLEAKRDWGHAKDYVEMMWLMLQQDKPEDYVIGTGEHHSVREFLEEAAKVIGLNIRSNGEMGVDEKYVDENENVVIEINPLYFRPAEVDTLLADPSKAKNKLGWKPKIKFKELVKIMAEHDLGLAEKELYLKQMGLLDIPKKASEITTCRICGNANLVPIINLGNLHLTGRFPSLIEKDPDKVPLELVKCDDSGDASSCGLVQLKHTADLGEMYGETYGYRSGLNQSMVNHLAGLTKNAEELMTLEKGDIALDIGSSDGVLLKSYRNPGLKRIGIDPTSKKYAHHYPPEIKLVTDFFSSEKFKEIFPDKKAKIITSVAMFYDLEEPMKFVENIKEILHPEGVWILEQSYMPKMLEINSFDTICQEHLEYYSFKQIEWMFSRLGLRIFDIDFNDVNGGSFRIYACHESNPRSVNREKLKEVRHFEKEKGFDTIEPYNEFAKRVEKIKEKLLFFLTKEKASGKKIHIYGASTKGNVLLQYFNIDKNLCEAAAEKNEFKWGKKTPGTGIPIISEEDSRNAKPDYYLVLPWHFKKGFIEREVEFLKNGGKFIFPMPEPAVVSIEDGKVVDRYL